MVGTSLNGQSLSDDILIDVRRHWYGAKVEDDGRRVRARPGMILGHVNAMLGRYGRRIGPDPASSHACTVGGVIANNSSGMRCTVRNDAYQTVSAMTFVTPSGAVIDTSAPDAEAAFERAEPDLLIAIAASKPLDALTRAPLASAGQVFGRLLAEAEADGQTLSVSAKFFTLDR